MRTKTSIFKGVSKFRDKWRARIGKNKTTKRRSHLDKAKMAILTLSLLIKEKQALKN